jgi:virulence factor lipase-like protein
MRKHRFSLWVALATIEASGSLLCYGQHRPAVGTAARYISGPSLKKEKRPVPTRREVRALFDLDSPDTTLFPSDHFTVRDSDQITRRKIHLPEPDCKTRRSDCQDVAVMNTLDGFSVSPRISIPWDGAIDISTVNSRTVFLIPLSGGQPAYRVIGIDQVVWNPERNRLFAKSADLLNQHSRYALIVTNGIRDLHGAPVAPSRPFEQLKHGFGASAGDVGEAIAAARAVGTPADTIVAATVFTTQSVTAILERIRDRIKSETPSPAQFDLGPGGAPTVFPLSNIASAVWNQQTGENPQTFNAVRLDFSTLTPFVGRIAFGRYTSPDYLLHPGEFIPPVGTRTGRPPVRGSNDIYFDLFLPSGKKPANGWPVAIWGHGSGGNKTVNSLFVAGTLAAHGIATIAINAVGQGFGRLGTLALTDTSGQTMTLSSGGRGVDQNADGIVGDGEGMSAAPPYQIIDDRDGFRQTVADLLQLVRVIETGVAIDGDRSVTLDQSRIYYVGQSLGAMYGALLLSVEPDILTATLTAPGGPRTTRRWNTVGGRAGYGAWLSSRTPPLTNSPGVIRLDGVSSASPPVFNENMPLPEGLPLSVALEDGTTNVIQSPMVDTVAGAFEIQQFFENTEWVMQAANPVAYAPHLIQAPLSGMPAKSVIVQFARGDQFVPNPANSTFLRAGELEDRAILYRHDLASADNPALPKVAHGFMVSTAGFGAISIGAQEQIAVFLASDGAELIHPEPRQYFEVPVIPPLPEDLGFIH